MTTTFADTLDQQALDDALGPYLPPAPISYGAVEYGTQHFGAVHEILNEETWDLVITARYASIMVPVGGGHIIVRVAKP